VAEEAKILEFLKDIAVDGFDKANAIMKTVPLFTMKRKRDEGVLLALVAEDEVAVEVAVEGADAEHHVRNHLLPGRPHRLLEQMPRRENPFASST